MNEQQLHAKIKRQKKALREMNRALEFYINAYQLAAKVNREYNQRRNRLVLECGCLTCRIQRWFR